MEFELTKHALRALEEREIPLTWVKRTLLDPELRRPDPHDAAVERHYRRIPEFDDRVLRVAVNTTVEPARVVSVFFDRRMKRRL